MNRGDIVIVDFPFVSGTASKKRPAVIIQNDRDNSRLSNTIIVAITGNTNRAVEPTQFVVDSSTNEGGLSGLHKTSVVNCTLLYTIDQQDVIKVIGRLSDSLVIKLNECLKAAIDIP